MKFFIPIGFRYGKGQDVYSHVGSVYGPYADDQAVEQALQRLFPNDKTGQFLVFDGSVVKVRPSPEEKPESDKRAPGNLENYVRDGDGYKCKDCGATIMGAQVAHPVHDGIFPGSGSGECRYETVPYCPNCEQEPSFHGAPIVE